MIHRRALLLGGLGWACGRPSAVSRGVAALRGLRAADGSFPSPVVGLLRSGHTTTPLAALALSSAGEPVDEHTWAFLARARDVDGALGHLPFGVEYPVYASALALSAAARAGRPEGERAPLRTFLLGQQLLAGWDGHPAEGGFPLGTRQPPTPAQPGHVDLSMTRTVAEALAADGHPDGTAAFPGVLRYTARSVGLGGGFVYSAPEPGLNKGGCDADGCHSYGTATNDGIRARLACGVGAADPLVAAAWRWWCDHLDPDRNPGLRAPFVQFAEAMRGYWWWGAATVASRLGAPAGFRGRLDAAIEAAQRPDGSWANPSSLQKEDCPVVATSLAILALSTRG